MTNPTNPIEVIYSQFYQSIQSTPQLERRLQIHLEKLRRNIYADVINQNTGYCMTFKVPVDGVMQISTMIDIDIKNIRDSFAETWKIPKNSYMYNNPYYHILILCVMYGLRNDNKSISETALSLLLCQIWNGRRHRFFKNGCKPDVMRYVIANLSGKYLAIKYDTPIDLIIQYSAPNLLEKYGQHLITGDSAYYTKHLFNQAYNRIVQLFISNKAPDLQTGENKARSGIATAYYAANKKGLKIAKPTTISAGDDIASSASEMDNYTSYQFEDVISDCVNYITMNINPKYEPDFIQFLVKATTANAKSISIILSAIHDIRYSDFTRDILRLMFKQMQITDKNEICSPKFIVETIKKKLISSKHTPNITQLKNIMDILLGKIFDEKVPYWKYSDYSSPRQGHIRKVLFYGYAYNIQKYLCTGNRGPGI